MLDHKPRVLYIDGWNILLAMNPIMNILDQNSMQIGMYLGTLNQVRNFVEKFKPQKIIFALDGPNGGERRRKLYPGYKAGRRVKAKTSSVTLQEGDDEYTRYVSQGAFTMQLEKVYNFLKTLPVTVVVVPYCEGDDLIAYLALKNKDDFDNIIVSGDKDYCQLIQEGIAVYNWREKYLYTEETFLEKFKIIPQNYIYMKCLLGDASDEIVGVKGIGDKTFPVFHECLSKKDMIFENVNDFVEHTKVMDMSDMNTRTKNAIKNLWEKEAVENMFLLYRVMKLDTNCLKLHHIETLRAQIEEQKGKVFSRLSTSLLMKRHQFNKLYNGFNEDKWLQPFVFVKPGVEINV